MNLRLLIATSFFSLLLSDAIYYISVSMRLPVDATYVIVACRLISLFCLLWFNHKLKWKNEMPVWVSRFFTWMILWNIIAIVRGIFNADDYWDWKYLFLNASFTMLIPYAMIIGILFKYSDDLFITIVTRLFVFGYLILPLTLKIDLERELFPRSMITVSFFLITIPYIRPKWRIVITCAAVASVVLAYDFRTNVMRIIFSLLLVLLYYCRKYITAVMLKLGCIILLTLPAIFLFLGVTGQYNIFKPTDNIDKYAVSYGNGGNESNLAIDTRTFLYQEVFASMLANNSLLLGEGAIGKYKTEYFDESVDQNRGRYGAEVGFLNTLLYTGIVGVVLYALVLFAAIYYGLGGSNNFFCKMLALFLAFRWVVFFIEDIVQYDMNYYFLWMSIGLCLSKDFRMLSDADIAGYFNFSKRKNKATTAQKKQALSF